MMQMNRNSKERLFQVINCAFFALVAFITLYPFYYVVCGSIMTRTELMNSSIIIFPKTFTFESYQLLFQGHDFVKPYQTTIFVTAVGTLLSLFLSTMGAYALSRRYLPGRAVFMTVMVITMLFNGGMIPTYIVIKDVGLMDTVWALIIPSAINTFYLIIMRTNFQSIPDSIEESAKLDGASDFTILFRICVPISAGIIATMALFYAVDRWNDLFSGLLYINNTSRQPVQVLLYRLLYVQQFTSENAGMESRKIALAQSQKYAAIVISTLPMLVIYPFLQRYFVKGVMIGSIKG